MRVKTNLKTDTQADNNPYHRLYLSLFEAAYGLNLSKNNTPTSVQNLPPSTPASEQDDVDDDTSPNAKQA
ncbi:MAG: hypothetical protein KDI79_11865 [Anaerolineae bacterium]|nr:hypothetical protein [Anaerolineae bacterium]